MAEGARVVTLSGRAGTWVAEDGFTHDALDWLLHASGDQAASPPADLGVTFREGAKPWGVAADIALPCATQNEVTLDDARALTDTGCRVLAEGANMPLTREAEAHLTANGCAASAGQGRECWWRGRVGAGDAAKRGLQPLACRARR